MERSTSTVGLPRESKIWRAWILVIGLCRDGQRLKVRKRKEAQFLGASDHDRACHLQQWTINTEDLLRGAYTRTRSKADKRAWICITYILYEVWKTITVLGTCKRDAKLLYTHCTTCRGFPFRQKSNLGQWGSQTSLRRKPGHASGKNTFGARIKVYLIVKNYTW